MRNIEITKYFNYEPRFNGVFSRDNLRRIKDRVRKPRQYISTLKTNIAKGDVSLDFRLKKWIKQ